ncbi:MAG: sigma-70 family RNA polymerase sigma factor [Bacteroidota bacterium]
MLRYLRAKEEPATDAELLTRFQQEGDQESLAQLFDRYLELIYGLCLQYLKTDSRAEDAVMGIYLELERKLPDHEVKNFKNWLFTVVRNFCLMQLRKEKKNTTVSFDPAFMHSSENWHPLEEETEVSEREEALKYCLEQLTEQQKACVNLFYYEGHSYKAIAEMRAEQVGRVRSNIQNGRRNLKNCIESRMS